MKALIIAATAAASLVATAASAQTAAPANPGPVIPGVCVYYNARLLAQSAAGQAVEARMQQLAQAAKAQLPNDPTINDTLGWVYVKRDMLQLATNQLEEAVRLAPDNPLMSYHLGVAYAKAGDDARARKALEKTLALDRNFRLADDAKKVLAKLVY